MRSSQKIGVALISLVTFAVVAALTYLYPWRAARHAREVGNCADMRTYADALDAYRAAHGRYPASLGDAVRKTQLVDRYDTPVRYESNGREFVLVSYGSDGKPETTNYWPYRLQAERRRTWEEESRQCAAGADVVFTDRGCYRCCGN